MRILSVAIGLFAAWLIIPGMIEDRAVRLAYDQRMRDACEAMKKEVTKDNDGRIACVDNAPAWVMRRPIVGGK